MPADRRGGRRQPAPRRGGASRRDPGARRAEAGRDPAGRRGGAGRERSPRRPEPAGDLRVTVEGRQAVRELLRARRRPVRELVVSDTASGGPMAEILALAEQAGVPVRTVGRPQLSAMAETDAPQGVVAVTQPLPDVDLDDLIAPRPQAPPPLLVVLDGVTDPHNLGAVMRSALCAGATGVVIGRHRAAALGPAATKAAAGAAEWIPVVAVAGIPAALGRLARAGVWTVGLAAEGGQDLWDVDLGDQPVAVVLGAEGAGLSRLARGRCDLVASIPMQGPLASLNVSAAATLACFEVARRRGLPHT